MDQSRLSLLALHFVPGLGDRLIRQLVSYCGSAEKVFQLPRGKLLKIPGVGDRTAKALKEGSPFDLAEKEIRLAEQKKVTLLFFTDAGYPKRLKNLDDAPSLLYIHGNANLEQSKTVGIVGTRRATNYGKLCIDELMQGLVQHDVLVVSGLAYGIDILAHKAAMEHGLPTVAVLGSGIDVLYPAAHSAVARKMTDHGAIVTEQPFGTKPDAHNFPARNRIIAGMSDALIVVEAGDTGGALITADIANSYNRDVFAFPGNIGQSYSAGCNNLIKSNKASLITSSRDLEFMMNWDLNSKEVKANSPVFDGYEETEVLILKTLHANGGSLVIDELSWKSNVPVHQLASVLLSLEFRGAVQSLPGKLFRLSKN